MLTLKADQKQLYDDFSLFLSNTVDNNKQSRIADYHESFNKKHGRIKTRRCYVSDQLEWLNDKDKWAELKMIVMIESIREATTDKVSTSAARRDGCFYV